MPAFICTACGVQYPPNDAPPRGCTICQEERQYVPPTGQGWTTQDELAVVHQNAYRQYEPGLIGIGTQPAFAIGQRALLVCTPGGNVLWDCISLLDAATVTLLEALGGVQAIAISHPHFYTTMVDWSAAFGDVPIYLHAHDSEWIMRASSQIELWQGDVLDLLADVTLIRCGGHFPGGTVLHWAKGAEGRGVLCSGDIAAVARDRKFLSFMRSYPNLIPLAPEEIEGIAAALDGFQFDRVYGHYFDSVIAGAGREVFDASIERYLRATGAARRRQLQSSSPGPAA
jgi:hypothetical protein